MKKKKKSSSPSMSSPREGKKIGIRAFAQNLVSMLMWVLGGGMYSVAVVCFIQPLRFISGGLTGVALIINSLLPFLSIGMLVFILNIPLFLAAWKTFGWKFIISTFCATSVLSLLMDVIGFFAHKYNWVYAGDDKLIGAIFGGVLAGAGLGVVFLSGATTGGTDILARLLKLKFPHISVGKLVLTLDFIIVLTGGIVYRNVESVLYSIVISFISGSAIDYVMRGRTHSKVLMILTSEPDKVTRSITARLGRGVSVIHAKGGYTNQDREMLLCVVRTHEVTNVRKIIAEYDDKPFIIVTDSDEVLGQGFKSHKDTL